MFNRPLELMATERYAGWITGNGQTPDIRVQKKLLIRGRIQMKKVGVFLLVAVPILGLAVLCRSESARASWPFRAMRVRRVWRAVVVTTLLRN